MASTLIYDVRDRVATVTLNRPDRLNAASVQMLDELREVLDQTDNDDDVRAVVFTGAGRAFCAGADLSSGGSTFDLGKRLGGEGKIDDRDPRFRDGGGVVNLRLWESKKPLIAAINGAAVGVGATMLLPMDIRIASRTAKFAYPFAKRGVVWDGASSWFLPRVVGISQAMQWGLTGRTFGADEALAARLVSALHEPDALLPAAYEIAQSIVTQTSPVSTVLMRQMAWHMMTQAHPMDAHRLESKAFLYAGMSADAHEGVNSFLEKRKPTFTSKPSESMPPYYPFLKTEEY